MDSTPLFSNFFIFNDFSKIIPIRFNFFSNSIQIIFIWIPKTTCYKSVSWLYMNIKSASILRFSPMKSYCKMGFIRCFIFRKTNIFINSKNFKRFPFKLVFIIVKKITEIFFNIRIMSVKS